MIPAKSRRPRMPTILSTATTMIAATARPSAARGGGPVGEGRQQHPVGDPTDDLGAGDGHAAVEAAAEDGEGEHPRLLDDGPADVTEAAPDDGVSTAGHGSPRRVERRCSAMVRVSLVSLTGAAEGPGPRRLGNSAMTASSRPFPDRERAELADLLDKLGPDAPTCCAGWTTAHLAAHLAVRDRRPDAMLGLGLEKVTGGGGLGSWAHRLEDGCARPLPTSTWSPGAVRSAGLVTAGRPGGQRFNISEFAIHHEDVRRAQPDWTQRSLPLADQDALWAGGRVRARTGAARRARAAPDRRRGRGAADRRRRPHGGRRAAGATARAAGRRDVARVTVS